MGMFDYAYAAIPFVSRSRGWPAFARLLGILSGAVGVVRFVSWSFPARLSSRRGKARLA